ncbi:ABC transporter permease [Cohnella lupini]|uniref:ABC-2 type transport system permease protein n=1 Tax=Cohnella lupini TaxID=1294267 RepID=A0A3D9ISK5_9BACL|nr:ABC transporter permease [Cohnella lupini]RED64742.1 ABC-2 type transport system permease protein [Cohnella lupini]
MNNGLWTVLVFTLRNKMRSKAFIIMTLVLAVLLVVVGNLPYLIDKLSGGDKATKVGYAEGQQPAVVQGLKDYYGQLPEPDIELVSIAGSEQQLKDALEKGDVSGYLLFADDAATGFPKTTYNAKSAFEGGTSSSLTGALQKVKTDMIIKDAGMSDEQKTQLSTPVSLETQKVSFSNEQGKTEEEQGMAIALTYVMIILLFMAVMISGQLIATEITAEKSSRVMEIIVTSVSPLKQMWGKILGTFIVAMVQLIILIGALVANLMLPHNSESLDQLGIDLSVLDMSLVVYAVLFYLAGFFLYATLFAAIGSIVSRTEDLGQALLPVTMLTLVGFYIALFGLTHPDHILILVCQYIPFFSPFLMFLRIGLAEPAWWEIVLSIGILLASILGIGWLSAKIYRVGVLMYGKRPSVKEIAKAMRAYKV